MLEDGDVAIFVADEHVVPGDQRRRPTGGQHVVRPEQLAGLGVQAVEQPAEVGHVKDVILDGHGSAGAVHRLSEVFGIRTDIVPDGGRVRIVTFKVAFLRHERLETPHLAVCYAAPTQSHHAVW